MTGAVYLICLGLLLTFVGKDGVGGFVPSEFQCIKNNPSVIQELACSQYLYDRRFMILTFDHMILKNFGSWRENWKYLYCISFG